jgi:hypothetical protein
VTLYAAALGVPVLLGAYHASAAHPNSGAAALAAIAPRLIGSVPVVEQLAQADEQFDAEAMARVAGLISSEPGGFARHTRALLYNMLGLGQPAIPARVVDAPPPRSLARAGGRVDDGEKPWKRGACRMSELVRITLSQGD